jgi:hypothetical protein
MPNLLEILLVLQPEVSVANVAKLSEIVSILLNYMLLISNKFKFGGHN